MSLIILYYNYKILTKWKNASIKSANDEINFAGRKDLSWGKCWIQQTSGSWTSEFCPRKLHPIRDYLKFAETSTPGIVSSTGVAWEFNQIEPLIEPVYFMSLLHFFAALYFDIGFTDFSFLFPSHSGFLTVARNLFLHRLLTRLAQLSTTYYVLLLSSRLLFGFEAKRPRGSARV